MHNLYKLCISLVNIYIYLQGITAPETRATTPREIRSREKKYFLSKRKKYPTAFSSKKV